MKHIFDWFSPPTPAWWFVPLVLALLLALALQLLVAYWPRRLNGALNDAERRTARGSSWRRWGWPATKVVAIALGLVCSFAFLALGPRRPCVLLYHTGAEAPDAAYWQEKLPPEHAFTQRLDPAPLVRSVIAQARREGASHWHIADDSHHQRLRELCLQALLTSQTTANPSTVVADPERLPAWITASVELTILHGLVRRENVRWAGIRCAELTPAWERARRLLGGGTTTVELFPQMLPAPVRVLAMFNGSATAAGKVTFNALVEGPVGTTTTLTFALFGSRAKESAGLVRQEVTLGQKRQVIPIAGMLAGLSEDQFYLVRNEDGTVQTPLVARDSLPVVVAVQGGQASRLVTALERAFKSNGLEDRLRQQDLPRPKFETRLAAPGEVSLVVRAQEVLVLAPGMFADAIPAGPLQAISPSGLEPFFGRRISYVGDQPSTDTSWMSVAVRGQLSDPLPMPADEDRQQSSGFLTNQKLSAGRILDPAKTAVLFPVVEQGQNGKLVRICLSVEQQGLLADAASLPESWEPARAQAFAVSVVWAVERVLSRESLAGAAGSEPTTTLTNADQQALSELGRRSTDAAALAMIGLCFLSMLGQAISWTRPKAAS